MATITARARRAGDGPRGSANGMARTARRPDPAAEPVSAEVLEQYLRDPRRAITEDGVVCLVCGRSFRHLTNTHLGPHGLTSDEYKQRFGYNMRRALMIAPVRRTHATNACRLGLADRIGRRPIAEDIELRRLGGRHPHALEEILTRQERRSRRPPAPVSRDGRGRFVPAASDAEPVAARGGGPERSGRAGPVTDDRDTVPRDGVLSRAQARHHRAGGGFSPGAPAAE